MILADFQKTVRRYGLLESGEGVVAAISGGPDSTALLLLLLEYDELPGLRLHAVHVNHALRGAASDGDEAFVRRLAERCGVPLSVVRAPLSGGIESDRAGNLEERGRRLRAAAFEGERRRLGFQRIALGHTRDDLAETLIMRLLRGSGLAGLSGLYPVVDGVVIRPLVDCSRDQVLAYLQERGEPYREDESNRDTAFLRNRVRHELIPLLERNYNPRFRDRLAVTARLIREDEAHLAQCAEEAWQKLDRSPEGESGPSLPLGELLGLPPALRGRVVRAAIRSRKGHLRRIDERHVRQVLELARRARGRGEKTLHLPGGLRIRADRGRLYFLGPPEPGDDPGPYELPLSVPGRLAVPGTGWWISARLAGAEAGCAETDHDSGPVQRALFSATLLGDETLQIRSRRPGDRYRPAGAPGSRKIGRMMIDLGVPRARRGRLPLLVSGETILWLPGRAPAEGYQWREESGEACLAVELLAGERMFLQPGGKGSDLQ